MNATMRFIVWGTIPIGSVAGGILGSTLGLLPTIWIGAIGSLLAFLPVLFSPVRSLQRMPEPLEEGTRDGSVVGEPHTLEDALAADDEGVVALHRPPLVTPDESR